MKQDIEKALEIARTPGVLVCPTCGDGLYAPMDKLSIALYQKCGLHIDENSPQERNLFKLVEMI